jgi:hypothetical protein
MQGSPQTPVPAPAAKPKSGGGALKIILIILGVFAFMFLLVVCVLVYACHRVKQAIQVDSKSGSTSLSIPGMTAKTGMTFTADELGIDIYPGAEAAKDGNMRMSIAGNTVVTAIFVTPDPTDKVSAFYKSKMASNATSMDFGGTAILTEKKSDKEQVTVTVTQDSSPSGGKTRIQIQHTTATTAN